jgi:hypothetical protein
MLEHANELHVVELTLLDRRIVKQLIDLLIRELIAHRRQDFAETFLADSA